MISCPQNKGNESHYSTCRNLSIVNVKKKKTAKKSASVHGEVSLLTAKSETGLQIFIVAVGHWQ